MNTKTILSYVRQLLAIFALAFAALALCCRAATIEPAGCIQRSAFPDFNGIFECFKICDDPDDSDPCPTCCPGGGGGPGGGGPGGPPPERRLPPVGGSSSIVGNDCMGCGGNAGPAGFARGGGSGGGGGNSQCCPGAGEGSEGGGEEQPGEVFSQHGGMAFWSVKQPRLNLFLNDKPLWYRQSRGPEVAFQLIYKNKMGTNGIIGTRQPLVFSVGTNWHTPWRSYIQLSPNPDWDSYFVYLGDGSVRDYIIGVDDPRNGMKLEADGTNFIATFNTGERRCYGPSIDFNGEKLWFLSRIEYPGAVTNRFAYVTTNGAVRLSKVIDCDNRETTFEYTNSARYSNLISKIIGPFGQTSILTYTNDQLISIKDMASLESKVEYDTTSRPSRLITPYGTNLFDYYAGSGWTGIRVSEHNLRKHFYLQGNGPTNLFPAAAADYSSLTNYLAVTGISETFDNTNLHQRNSYYWGPRQYGNLSSGIRNSLDTNGFQITDLTTNEFNKGHTHHWLNVDVYLSTNDFVGDTLAMERYPGPNSDGSSEGLIIWYDHMHKASTMRELEGNPKAPKTKAWRFSSADWRVVTYDRDYNGRVKMRKFNYGEPGAVRWQTDSYVLSGNVDVTSLSGANAYNYTNTYNGFHQVTAHVNALGETNSYQYDSLQRLTNITYPNGLITSYAYDGNGYVSTVIDRSSVNLRTNSYTWTNGLIFTHTDERGLTFTNVYDVFGRLIRTSYPDGTYVTNVYDKFDLIRIVDRMGFTHGFAYNGFRQLLRHTNANQKVTTYGYCDCGSLESITDPIGNATTFTIDNAGRRTRTTFPGGSGYTDVVYDTPGHVIRTSDSSGVNVTNGYTINGLLYTATNAFGRIFSRQYDANSQVRVSIDQNGVTNSFSYDPLGRISIRTNNITPGGPDQYYVSQERYEYAANITGPVAVEREFAEWNVGFSTNNTRLSARIEYGYDLLGRKTNEVHVGLGGASLLTNRFTYSPAGDLLTMTDGKAQTTTWKYDQYGRVTNKVDATSADMFRYAYDVNGRLTNRWSPARGTTKYSYDSVGNLTSIDYPSSTDIALQYDDNNRVTNMVDATGSTRFTYAAFGALLSEDGPWENDTVTWSYDNRRRSGVSVQAPNASSWSQGYTYDAGNRLSTVSSPAGTFTYTYHSGLAGNSPASLIKKIALPNTAAITNNYDSHGHQLGAWLRNNSGTLLASHQYIYNDLDQRTQMIRADGSYVDYTYDDLGQLKSALGKESGGTTNRWHEQFTYAYDAAGNLTNRIQYKLTNSFSVNLLNEITNSTRSGRFTVTGTTTSPATNVTVNTSNSVLYLDYTFASTNHSLLDGTNTFTAIGKDNLGRVDTNTCVAYLPSSPTFAYDANGNLTYDGHKALEYDDENQLTRITATNLWKSEFAYDGKLRRRIRREYTWQNSAWVLTNEVRYVYDGNLVIQERNSWNVPAVTYTRGSDLSGTMEGAGGIGGLLARTDNAIFSLNPSLAHACYFADANGNVTALIDSAQRVVATYLYDPFGKLLSMSGPLADANLYRFSSKEAHPSSGLAYYLYRYCDANSQRWVTADPRSEPGFETVRLRPIAYLSPELSNLYQYVNNAPTIAIDLFGLSLVGTAQCVGSCWLDYLWDLAKCAGYSVCNLAAWVGICTVVCIVSPGPHCAACVLANNVITGAISIFCAVKAQYTAAKCAINCVKKNPN